MSQGDGQITVKGAYAITVLETVRVAQWVSRVGNDF
jgi:hypothetical protein